MKKIKIFGERNCGTNYIRELIIANIEAELLEGGVPVKKGIMKSNIIFDRLFDLLHNNFLGWKHSFPNHKRIAARSDLQEILFVTITKNPYSFLLSLYNRPYHYKGSKPDTFYGFLTSNWDVLHRENSPTPILLSPVHLWNMKNGAYINLKREFPENTINLTYEALLREPGDVLSQICRQYGFDMRADEFQNLLRSTKDPGKDHEYYRSYYLDELWKNGITEKEVSFINSHLDREVVRHFGYETL